MSNWDHLLKSKYGAQNAEKMRLFRDLVWSVAGYSPTPIQNSVLRAARLTKLISGGIRAGKSITSAMSLADFCCIEGEIIWLVGDTYEDSREEFKYLYVPLARLGLVPDDSVSMPYKGAWRMQVSGGAEIMTKSSGDLSKLASVAPIAQLYTEAAQQHPDIFDKALERALQNDGFVLFSGTLEASKQLEFTNLLIKWKEPEDDDPATPQSWSMPTWSNTHIFPEGRSDPKFRRMIAEMTPEKFDERVAAVPYRPEGLVHKRFNPDRNVAPLKLDPEVPVHIAIDPGYTSYVVLFVQRLGEYVHVLDEVYRHEALTHDIVAEVMSHPLWEFVEWGIIDKAARQHHANESVWEVWRRLTGIPLITRAVSVQDGIDAIETRCMDGEDGDPRLLINSDMSFDVGRDGRSNSLRGEFNLRKWPRFKVNHADGIQPIKSNDHALNALGYYLFHWYRQEQMEKTRPRPTGGRTKIPARLESYNHRKPNYVGSTARSTIHRLPRKKRQVR